MPEPQVWLAKGRRSSLERRHPWVFAGAVDRWQGSPGPGDTVLVRSHDGRPLGRGAWSPDSGIRVRMWTFDDSTPVGAELLAERVEAAVHRRGVASVPETGAMRLIHAESDGIPGLTVDAYAGFLVAQFQSVGPERWKRELTGLLASLAGCRGVYERSDGPARGREGLAVARGRLAGEAPDGPVEVAEGPARFRVDVERGHKTGFYLDQAANRAWLRGVAGGAELLNAFSYTGAFGVHALLGGARRVVHVDSSAAALEACLAHEELNGVSGRSELRRGNAFDVLRALAEDAAGFDVVVLDPPKFADSKRSVPRAARGYKDINRLGMLLLRPGGRLVTFSCSGHLDSALFQKIVADAALDAGRVGRIERRLDAGPDHPVELAFPEGRYLKGLVIRVE